MTVLHIMLWENVTGLVKRKHASTLVWEYFGVKPDPHAETDNTD